ncbi:MAG TPA: HAMP domain-containing methyl-accepting chemotaxis protein, partial [Ktedonobacteraceae bacterium]|nr:HAMP domain-containing methyl-accepting chemotaxis protein [Ktedonobacteraceae bacterium]
MVRFLYKIPIFRRLFMTFMIVAIIPAIIIILLDNFYLSSLTTRGQAVQISFDAQSIASTEQGNLLRMNALLQTRHDQVFASLSNNVHDPSLAAAGGLFSADIAARAAEFNLAVNSYSDSYEIATSSNMSGIRSILLNDNATTGPGIIKDQQDALHAVTSANGLWTQYKGLQESELQQLQSLEGNTSLTTAQLAAKYNQAYLTLWKANNVFTDLKNNWQRVVDDAVAMGKTVTAVGASISTPITVATIIAVAVTFLIVLVTGWLVNQTITNPLRSLATLTRRIGKGDTSARANIQGRDEIALVANSMNKMLDNIVNLIQQTQAQRDNLQAQVEKLVGEVSIVGEGDLRIQAEVTNDALGVLADSFNYMVEELGSLIVRVKSVALEVERSTSTILNRMMHLVEADNNQINQINLAVISVERMADASHQVASRAQVLYGVAREAQQSAQGGRESVQQAVEGIGRISTNVQTTAEKVQTLGERSLEINNIIDAISGIAHQTNRLALDAAIQAAMAGENGKGFAAVAADIRRLAERAKDQAGMITKIVRSVREDIGAVAVSMQDTERETSVGATLTEEAGAALLSIFSAVEQQAKEINSINQVTAQQVQTSNDIVTIMRRVSDGTQQSSIETREASQNMERLARLVEQLRASTEAFKLQEMQNSYASPPPTSLISEEEQQISVSGYFRTVTAEARTSPAEAQVALPTRWSAEPSLLPPPQQTGWNGSAQQNQQWYPGPPNQ